MNRLLIIFIAYNIITATACKAQPNPKVWTKKYEQGFYNYLDSTSKPTMPNKVQREKYVNFFLERLKQEIPNGLNSVSKDSLKNLNIRLGREYALIAYQNGEITELIPVYERWTPLIDKTFRDNFKAIFSPKYPKTTDKFCDCVLEKLKKMYPNSVMVPVPQNTMNKVALECKPILEP
ncbi:MULTISPECIES: hypothetical protein [unclassified Mucilaginibacter]|uniref:hypothetical protein n=1 Tax=unclassified Mucilaginibacter TaxID=2617802 RepID=UPI002AC9ACC5|nr:MULTISPECIES: hypothetical protein [unclassified Mucilaginibacter]MEB0263647.1 hypothetical protein [Mucilaginibacter sp. 10I4]MEB0277881.1 hypothetical protein [Mucilaginibacter sp. 10B2]MEB0300572.1 hypothetical protein [Mucilaginibacter sp. 5C4]WPX22773.1 hypothetical protein RHM67_15940 [Mucilaginibacter sp. 5C4]